MKFIINWVKTPTGNGIKEDSILRINAKGAAHISGAIYQKGFPILAIFGKGDHAEIKVSRKGMNLKGMAILKISAFDKQHKGYKVTDGFVII